MKRKPFIFETLEKPLLSRRDFLYRQARFFGFSFSILAVSMGIGVVGYHTLCGLSWVDSFLNASMILTGMWPVDKVTGSGGKLFAAFYALFSGVAFLSFAAVLFAPLFHRFLHKFHLSMDEEDDKE